MASANVLLSATRFMLPRSHFLHRAVIALLRLSEGISATSGNNLLQTINNLVRADAFSAARVISAVSAARNEALSNWGSSCQPEIPSPKLPDVEGKTSTFR